MAPKLGRLSGLGRKVKDYLEGTGSLNKTYDTDLDGVIDDASIPSTITRDSELATHTSDVTNPHSVTKTQVGLGDVENIKVKLDATVAPTVDDDSDDGYSVQSRWTNITADTEYVCLDATVGAAVWTETTGEAAAVHDLGGVSHNADTLANLNSKVSDATLIDTDDSRLSDDRDPNAHATEHVDGVDDIRNATNALKGLATPDQITNLEANVVHKTSDGSDHGFIDQSVVDGASPTFDGANLSGIPNDAVDIEVIGTPEVTDIKALRNHEGSVGILHPGSGVITDDESTKFQIAAGDGQLRATGSLAADLISMEWLQTDILYSSLVTGNVYYIYVENVAGTATIQFTDTEGDIDHLKDIDLGSIWFNGENLITNNPSATYNNSDRHHESITHMFGYIRTEGAMISEPANLKLKLTASHWHLGFTEFDLPEVDTSVADTFTYFHQTTGTWTEVTTQTDIDNLYYNDITSGLVELGISKFGVHWIYLNSNGGLFVVYGTGSYGIAEAIAASTPSSLPPQFPEFCKLVGKAIVQKSGVSLYSIESPFIVDFETGVVTIHNELGGLNDGDYKHLTDAEKTLFDTIEENADVTDSTNVDAAGAVMEYDYDAHTMMRATSDNVPLPLTIGEQTLVGRITAGNITALTPAQVLTLIAVAAGADVTGDNPPQTHAMSTHTDDGALAVLNTVDTSQINDDAVTYVKMQNIVNDERIWGRVSGAGGIVEELTKAQVLTMLNVVDGANNYVHPNHTGEVTSTADGAQVVDKTAISGKGVVTAVGTDYVLIGDTSDAGNLKKALVSDFGGSGDVATDSIWDTAGDIVVGTGADTAAKLVIGSSLQIPRVNVGGTTLEYATLYTTPPLSADGAVMPVTNGAQYNQSSGATIYPGHSWLGFDDTTDESAFWWLVTPRLTTTLDVDIYWYATAITGDVVFDIGLITFGDGDTWQSVNPVTTAISADTVAGTTLYLNKTTVSAYNPTSVTNADEMGLLKLTRDANNGSDTMGGDAKVMFVVPRWG